jgi:hypothetical protein
LRKSIGDAMKKQYFYPLFGFIVPTLVIGYGFVIPHSCIKGINAQSVGFGTTVLGAGIAYCVGVWKVVSTLNGGKEK